VVGAKPSRPPVRGFADRERFTTTAPGGWEFAPPIEPPYLLTTVTSHHGVRVAVSSDATTAVVEMAAHGPWSPHLGEQISAGLRLCLAGPSVSIVVDLHRMDDPSGLSMPFWLAACRQAWLAPTPVQIVLCMPEASALSRRLEYVEGARPRVFNDVPEARMAIAEGMSRTDRRQARLAPRPGSVQAARHLVQEACRTWHLSHLLHDASLAVSELAGNAVEHARTDFVVTVSRNANRLNVAVKDDAPGFPRLHKPASGDPPGSLHDHGRGLLIVHTIAAGWGDMPARVGKVVWATLM